MTQEPTHVKPNDPRLKLSQSAVDFARERNAALRDHFGFSTFHPGQAEALDSLQHGRDVLAVLPTGSGKTLVYELATYLLNGRCLIVSPLLSLMQDQVGRLNARGERRAVAINSTLNRSEQLTVLNQLATYRFIYVSPEMLANEQVISALQRVQLRLFVVDEAHCISTWGPDFRPAYLSLGAVRQTLGQPLTLALTATADQHVRTDICECLKLSSTHEELLYSVDRKNIFLDVEQCQSRQDKDERLLKLVQQLVMPGIVYFSSKNQADEWAERLVQAGISAASYHAGLDAQTRFTVQQQFMQDQLQVVCATSAFGMGIDKADIRFVIHYHLPGNLTDYVQEIGRAGRDGNQSVALLLLAPGDSQLPAAFTEMQLPDERVIHHVFANGTGKQPDGAVGLVAYYKDHGASETAVIDRFNERRRWRQDALSQIVNYAQNQTCLRSQLRQAFGETSEPHTETCCAPGSVPVDLPALGLAREEKATTATPALPSWQTQFQTLFSENFTN
ncbi:RecQ family ATP-dependent DNA helicase [Furfurilactobacillus sp. WILCCON 0119]